MHGDPFTAIFEFASFVYQWTMGVTVVFFVLDLLLGIVLLALFGRKRHLWWVFPLVNVALWFTLTRALPNPLVKNPEDMWIDLLGVAAGVLAAGVSASILSLVHLGWREIGKLRKEAKGSRALPERFNRPARTTPYPSFVEGITTPWEGFAFLCYYPALWRYGVIPILLNVIITFLVLVGLLAAVIVGSMYLWNSMPEGWWWRALEVLLIVALVAAAVGLSLVAWLLLEGILCGYFYGKLARQMELQLGTPEEELREVSFLYQIVDTILDVTTLIAVNGALLLLHIVPVIGSIVAICLAWYFNAFWFGLDYFSFSLCLRAMRRKEQRAYCRAHRGHTIGLGTAVVLLHLLPIVGSLLLTTAAAGAVLLRRRIELAKVESPESRIEG